MSIDADLAAAIALAETEATARIAAAVASAQIAAQATEQSAVTQAQADTTVATTNSNAQKQIAVTNKTADVQVAGIAGTAATTVATTRATADETVATTTSEAQKQIALTNATADVQVAGVQSDTSKTVALTAADADKTVATTRATADTTIATTAAQADVQVAGIQANAQVTSSGNQLTGVEYSADKQLDGVEVTQTSETQRLVLALNFAQDKWNQVWPFIQTYLQNPNQGSGALSWTGLLAAIGAAPYITTGGVYTPSQLQTQVNLLYARADQKSQTLLHDAQIDLAGRGFGGSSPLLDMLRFSYEAENIETSTEGAAQLTLQSSKENVLALLSQQTERQTQYAAAQKAFTDLDKIAVDLTTGIFGSVAQIISSASG